MRVADVFESIFGQAQVRDYLRTTLRTGRLSHAYLFTGPPGSNKTSAAYAFAQAERQISLCSVMRLNRI